MKPTYISPASLEAWLIQHGYPVTPLPPSMLPATNTTGSVVAVHLDHTHIAAISGNHVAVLRGNEGRWMMLDEFMHLRNPGEVDRILDSLISYKTYRRARGRCVDMTGAVCRGRKCPNRGLCVDHCQDDALA